MRIEWLRALSSYLGMERLWVPDKVPYPFEGAVDMVDTAADSKVVL